MVPYLGGCLLRGKGDFCLAYAQKSRHLQQNPVVCLSDHIIDPVSDRAVQDHQGGHGDEALQKREPLDWTNFSLVILTFANQMNNPVQAPALED
jgi:hypothetical protein